MFGMVKVLTDGGEVNPYSSGSRKLSVERSVATGHRLSEYDGVCGNVHGHNIKFEVEVRVEMDEDDSSNMPLDLKDISSVIDQLDHVLVLSVNDEMLEIDPTWSGVPDDAEFPVLFKSEVYGPVYVFEGDPTCEVIAQYIAEELIGLNSIFYADVIAYETDKYSVAASAEDY